MRRPDSNHIEKWVLREAFKTTGLLPLEVLYRKKEAFSDGVSNQGRSLNIILQEQISLYMNLTEQTDIYKPSIKLEKMYYKKIFDNNFPNCSHILPYFWMPNYVIASDPSARTLPLYKFQIKN
jgi:asparagine synthase (glutamine-hydrolysing)